MAWHPSGDKLAGAAGNSIQLWSSDGKLAHQFSEHQLPVRALAWSRDGERLATASHDRTIRIWTAEGKVEQVLEGLALPLETLSWPSAGQRLAAAGDTPAVGLWNTPAGEFLGTLVTLPDGHVAMFSPGGRLIRTSIEELDNVLIYVVEQPDQIIQLIPFSAFCKQATATSQ